MKIHTPFFLKLKRMRSLVIAFCLAVPWVSQAQEGKEIALYQVKDETAIPVTEYTEIRADGSRFVFSVSHPTITFVRPEDPNGIGVVLCPGGGYKGVSIDNEGFEVADVLANAGFTVGILKYRTPVLSEDTPAWLAPLEDLYRALELMRDTMTNDDPEESRVGVMGFSAGGHLAALSAIEIPAARTGKYLNLPFRKPDFVVLAYPVITMREAVAHEGSRKALLGDTPSDEEVSEPSVELHVTASTPPLYLMHARDDASVSPLNSVLIYASCLARGVPAKLHLLEKGGHGFGMGLPTDVWIRDAMAWMYCIND